MKLLIVGWWLGLLLMFLTGHADVCPANWHRGIGWRFCESQTAVLMYGSWFLLLVIYFFCFLGLELRSDARATGRTITKFALASLPGALIGLGWLARLRG